MEEVNLTMIYCKTFVNVTMDPQYSNNFERHNFILIDFVSGG
jgi:hypothetical protein